MKIFRLLNDDGDIEVSSFVNPSVKFQDGLYSEIEELCVYEKTFNIYNLVNDYEKLQQENKKLKDNWNKLKEYMIKEQTRIVVENIDEDEFIYTDLLNKMQELSKDF